MVEGADKTHRWIVDPLDGTTNFLHGIPLFSIAIALEREGEIVAGLVYNPILDELYTAEKGQGAFVNSRRLRVAARKTLADASLPPASRIAAGRARAIPAANARHSWARSPAFAAPARPPSTSPGWPPAASTATASAASGPWDIAAGICWCARPAGTSQTSTAAHDMLETGSIVAGNAQHPQGAARGAGAVTGSQRVLPRRPRSRATFRHPAMTAEVAGFDANVFG